jgi:hypothetical protein
MSKDKGIDWGALVKTDSPALQWTLLFAIYLIVNIAVQGWGHFAFTYTMVYTLAFLLIGITISKATAGKGKAIGTIFAIMTVFVGTMTWITSMSPTYTGITPETLMWITIIFTVLALLNEYGVIETEASINNKYALLAALGGMFLFGFLYFLGRLGLLPPYYSVGPLEWHTILNHLGITFLAGTDMLLIFGVGEWEKWRIVRWIFFFATVIGALAMLNAGWGLRIR